MYYVFCIPLPLSPSPLPGGLESTLACLGFVAWGSLLSFVTFLSLSLSFSIMPYLFEYFQENRHPPANRRRVFTGLLQCDRCAARMPKRNNQRCSRRVCMGLPYCHSHVTSQLHVKIMPSTLENAGKGLFAYQSGVKLSNSNDPAPVVFVRDQTICPYAGEHLTNAALDARYSNLTAPYGAKLFVGNNVPPNQRFFEDAALHRGIGAFPNHSVKRRNARIVFDDFTVPGHTFAEIQATKPIRHGQEIFIDYGAEYIGEGKRISHEGPFKMSSDTRQWRTGKPLPPTSPIIPRPESPPAQSARKSKRTTKAGSSLPPNVMPSLPPVLHRYSRSNMTIRR